MLTPEEQEKALKEFIARHSRPYDPDTDDYDRPPFAADIKEGKNDPIYNAHSYHTKVPPRGIIPYILHYSDPGDLILDPFCGSGMTGVAAQMCVNPPADLLEQFPELKNRVGRRTCILNDLSPAACHIAYNYNMPVDVEALQHEFDRIKAAVKDEFDWLYGTEHYEPAVGRYDPTNSEVAARLKNPPDGSSPTLLGHEERSWELLPKAAVEARLGYPATDLPRDERWNDLDIFNVTHWISIPATIQHTVWSDIYRCEGLVTIEEPTGKLSTRGRNVGKPIVSRKRVRRGCGVELNLWHVAVDHRRGEVLDVITCPHCGQCWRKPQMQLLRPVPVNVCYECVAVDGTAVRHRRPATAREASHLASIEGRDCPYWYPKDKMPLGRQTRKTMSGKGIYTVDQYYSPRARWALARMRHEIITEPDPSVQSHLLWAFSAILVYASRMNRHNFGSQPSPLRGTFYVSSFVEEANTLRLFAGKLKTVRRACDALRPHVGNDAVVTRVGSADDLPIPSCTVDYVYCDPPFGEALQYAELNFIWEAWLGQFTDIDRDCVVNYVHKKSLEFYASLMKRAFEQMHRLLKPGRWASIVFKNTDDQVWDQIKKAAVSAGFTLVNALEFDKRQRTFNQVNRAGAAGTDIVMNLRKPPIAVDQGEGTGDSTEQAMWDAIRSYVEKLPDQIRQHPDKFSSECRTTAVLHSVVMRARLSAGGDVRGVSPEAIDRVCRRYLRNVDGRWYFPGERIMAGAGAAQALIEVVEVVDEPTAIQWLHSQLKIKPMTEGELNTEWKVATLRVSLDKSLDELLAENFWRGEESRRWREPTDEEQAVMRDDRSIRVLHDAERFVDGQLKRRTTDGERCEWIEVLFQACRACEDNETQAVPALRGFEPGEGYRLISRLFQSILREKVPGDAYGRAEKQARVASQRISKEMDAETAAVEARQKKKEGPTLFDGLENA